MEKTSTKRSTLSSDLIAGLTASIPSVPDAMASGVLAGVNPIYGLYGLMIGTPIAAIFTGSAFMSVVTTSTMSITIGTALVGFQGEQQMSARRIMPVPDPAGYSTPVEKKNTKVDDHFYLCVARFTRPMMTVR